MSYPRTALSLLRISAVAIVAPLTNGTPSVAAEETSSASDAGQLDVHEPADGRAPLSTDYAEEVAMGMEEYERAHYSEAYTHFERAHALAPTARTLRALGNVEFELRNYGDAVRHLHAALASEVRPLSSELRAETEAVLARAQAYVDPSASVVMVDGVAVGNGPEAALDLLVGDHILEFRAGGRLPERRVVHVSGGDRIRLQVRLSAPGHVPLTGELEIRAVSDREPAHGRRVWAWVTVSAIAAALAVGLGVGLAPRGHHRDAAAGGSTGVVLSNP